MDTHDNGNLDSFGSVWLRLDLDVDDIDGSDLDYESYYAFVCKTAF